LIFRKAPVYFDKISLVFKKLPGGFLPNIKHKGKLLWNF